VRRAVFWTSLAMLVTNDHWLKRSGTLPAWLTGKLSDFAGFCVAILALRVVLNGYTLRYLWLPFLVVVAPFTAIKLFPAATHAAESASPYWACHRDCGLTQPTSCH
jgi:hypothetical protein